jgi:hypothetical protein
MTKRSLLILEIIWIIIGAASIIAGIHNIITANGNKVLIFLLMGIIAFAMAWLRHHQRNKS